MCIYTYVCKVKSSSVGVFFFRGYNKYSRFGIARIIWSGNRKEETGGKSTTRFFSRDGIILLLLFRCGGVTYVRTYRVSGEALPGELEIGDVGRDGNDEVHCVRINHSFPHVVQLGLQPWKKKKAKQIATSVIDRRLADDQLWKRRYELKVFLSARLSNDRAPRVKRLPSSYREGRGTLTRISFNTRASEKLIVDSTIYIPTLINVPSSHTSDNVKISNR